jgi:hypothetical protein
MLTTLVMVLLYIVLVLCESHIDLIKDHYQLRGELLGDSYEVPFYEKSNIDIEIIE